MNKESAGDRIRARRKELKLTQKALAAKVGVSHVAVSQWEKDETVPRGENLLRVSEALGCAPAWIVDGEGEIFNFASPPANFCSVPVIPYAQAAHWTADYLLRYPEHDVEFVQSNMDLSASAFALVLQGSAMAPEFYQGDCVIIEPAIFPLPGDFVAAKNGDEAVFMKYRPRGVINGENLFELVPLNEDYPVLRSHQCPLHIIGTMVEHRRYRRRDA
ncbi:helix-turn-helix domain-containing protein [Pantoea osteomyelitidis]|uniref:Helix-turn-helix domain-containing protein n=1 Tax=Pantoea osteomyelitidis TaxID=3230026 RepID=A0ABW7PXE6_9GAMM